MNEKTNFDIAIIGGGIVGLATAYRLSNQFPDVSLVVLEKEDRLAYHQTGHNSGVIHSGLYYRPGSQKALTCAKGRRQLVTFAAEHNIPHKICGKIIVATQPEELPALDKLYQNALENRIEGVEKIAPTQIRQIEPYCSGLAGLWVPCTGIIDFVSVSEKLAELVTSNPDNRIYTRHLVKAFRNKNNTTQIITTQNTISARFVINCAGLHCDRIARMYGVNPSIRIVPFRGDYMQLTPQAAGKIKALIYPVPDPKFPFLGVHFTRMIDESVECGPNAVFSFKREGYSKFAFSLKDTFSSLSFTGTWLLFAANIRYGFGEYTRAFCKRLMLKQLKRLVPSLELSDLLPGKSGVRAQALGPDGQLIDDFKIETTDRSIHILNAPSPAATASLAIGQHIADLAKKQFNLN